MNDEFLIAIYDMMFSAFFAVPVVGILVPSVRIANEYDREVPTS